MKLSRWLGLGALAAVCGGAVLGAGCLPYVVPPMTAAVGATRTAEYSKPGVHVDFGLAPLQLVKSQIYRQWDVQLVGSFENVDHNVWGAGLIGGPLFYPWGTWREGAFGRLSPQLVARLDTEGQSLGMRTVLELSTWTEGQTAKGEASGAYGEAAIGLYVETAYKLSDEVRDDWTITAGLSLRVPFMAGIACCMKL